MPLLAAPRRAARWTVVSLLLCALAGSAVVVANARGDRASQLTAARARRDALRRRAAAQRDRVSALDSSVRGAQARLAAIEADVSAKEQELAATRAQLASARHRLIELQSRLQRDQRVLARQLRAGFEGDRPDALTVLLEARGFADLLERVAFLKRVNHSNVEVIDAVKRARRAVVALATRLGALELRQQRIVAALGARRDELASLRAAVQARRDQAAGARDQTLSELDRLDRRVRGLQSSNASSSSSGSGSGSSPPPAHAHPGGGFVFPLPKSVAASPGSWSLDDGVDISAPGHTPLYAVGSGTIVLHGIGGFGDWAPVLHLDDGRYVYYGHAGPGNGVAVGTHVSAGQVIGEVGAGIVGISTGPHLEIGFAGSSGAPLGPSTAGQMEQLLQGAY